MAAHRYWRLQVHSFEYAGRLNLNILEFREVAGVAQQATGGTPLGDGGATLPNLFDNNNTTVMVAFDGTYPRPQSYGYDFGSGNEIDVVEIGYHTNNWWYPKVISVWFSDNGTDWIPTNYATQPAHAEYTDYTFTVAPRVNPVYWGVLFHGISGTVKIAEMDMYEVGNGAEISNFNQEWNDSGITDPDHAFNNNWSDNAQIYAGTEPKKIGCMFNDFYYTNSDPEIEFIDLRSDQSDGITIPESFSIVSSENLTDWLIHKNYYNESGWGTSETRRFDAPYVAPTGTTHRYWRLRVDKSDNDAVVKIGELHLHSVIGGGPDTHAGFNSEIAFGDGGTPNNAFDNSWGSIWESGSSSFPQYIGWDFGTINNFDILQIAIRSDAFGGEANAPEEFALEYSDDNSAWFQYGAPFTGETGWGQQQLRTFTLSFPATGFSEFGITHNIVIGLGKEYLPVTHEVIEQKGITGVVLQHKLSEKGQSILPTTHSIGVKGLSNLPISHVPYSLGSNTLGLRHVPQQEQTGFHWDIEMFLDGVDVSLKLTGSISITATQSAARLATFIFKPDSGVIDSQEWVKKSVTINYKTFNGAILQTDHRRFTGIVNTATYDPTTRLTTFHCTDDLQGSLEALDFVDIEAAVGGLYSPDIFSETDDGWEYTQQRLESQTSSYDKNHYGAGRKWDWLSKASADILLTQSEIVDNSLTLTQSTSRNIINKVIINLDYRYSRKWQREQRMSWRYGRTFEEYLLVSSDLPTRDMIIGAINRSWWIKSASFIKLPESGSVNINGTIVGWHISDELREQLAIGANVTVAKRWLQDMIEKFEIVVKCDASIAYFGEVDATNRYAVDTDSNNEYETESDGTIKTLGVSASSNSYVSTDYIAPLSGSVADGNDFYLDDNDRSLFDDAVQTAIAVAKVDILKSHHQNEVSARILLNPRVDLGKTIEINVPEINAKGTIGKYVESFNLDNGSATSNVSINVYAPNVGGQTDDPIATPTLPSTLPTVTSESMSLDTHLGGGENIVPIEASWRGFLGNFAGGQVFNAVRYPHEFRAEIPEVNDLQRNKIDYTIASTVDTSIPQETLIINA